MGGEVATYFESLPLPELFGSVAVVNIGVALLLFALAKPVKKLLAGVH